MTIIQVMVAMVGLTGNIMSVLVLSMKEKKNCFNYLLMSLAMFDTVFIILVTMDYSFARGSIFSIFNIWHSLCLATTMNINVQP